MPPTAAIRATGSAIRSCVGQALIGELMDEGGIGAVLEQPADEISEKIAMAANRRVDSGVIALLADQILVKAFSHAVQPLEFEVAAVAGPFENSRDGQRIVGREGREDVARREHVLRASEVGNVGRGLAGEERIIGEALFLAVLDLAVPIGALDQADRDPAARLRAQRVGPVEGRPGALAIGLDRHSEPVPALQRRQAGDRLDDVEAHLEPLALLGVDREGDVRCLGERRQRFDLLDQRRNAAIIVHDLVARMESRELDRDRMAALRRPCRPPGSPGRRRRNSARRRGRSGPPRRACRSSR